jgi:hypothetical protein
MLMRWRWVIRWPAWWTYQITGTGQWHPITGTALTTTTHPPRTVVERRTHLIDHTCPHNPTELGC